VDVSIGLVVLGRQPGPAGQLRRSGEPTHLADLGNEHRREHRTDTGELLHRGVSRMGNQLPADQPGEQVDLLVQVVDQAP